jgi:hypothetical protein
MAAPAGVPDPMQMTTRLLGVAAALLATAALLAPAGLAERLRLNSADMAAAARIDLTANELSSDWRATKPPSWDDNSLNCPAYHPKTDAFTITGRHTDAYIHPSLAVVESMTVVFRSVGDARGDFAASFTPTLGRCLTSSKELHIVSVKMVPPPAIGERNALYSISASVPLQGTQFPVHIDVLAIQTGRALSLLFLENPFRPLPNELALGKVAQARMAALAAETA